MPWRLGAFAYYSLVATAVLVACGCVGAARAAAADDDDDGSAPVACHSYPCSPTFVVEKQFQLAVGVTSLLSMVGSGVVVYTWFRYKLLQRHPNSIIMASSASDFMWYLYFVARAALYLVGIEKADERLANWLAPYDCGAGFLSMWTQFFVLLSYTYLVCLFIDLYRTIRTPFVDYRLMTRIYHVVAFTVATGSAFLLLVWRLPHDSVHQGQGCRCTYPEAGGRFCALINSTCRAFIQDTRFAVYGPDNYLQLCWVQARTKNASLNIPNLVLFYIPLATCGFIAFVSLALSYRKVAAGLPETAAARTPPFAAAVKYVAGLAPYWSCMGFLLFVDLEAKEWRLGADGEVLVRTVFGALLGLRGVITCILWLLTNDVAGARASYLEQMQNYGMVTDQDLSPALNEKLKSEIMQQTSSGIVQAVNRLEAARARARGRKVDYPDRARYDIVIDASLTRLSFCRDICCASRPDLAPRRRAKSGASTSTSGTAASYLSRSLSRGFSTTPGAAKTGLLAGEAPSAARERDGIDVRPLSDEQSADGVLFEEYDGLMYAAIRERAGISSESYQASFKGTVAGNFSGGASGAFMYFSQDRRYIVKTMERSELKVLRRMLRPYARHISEHSDSLLPRFMGCYRIRVYGKDIYFVVQNNLFRAEAAPAPPGAASLATSTLSAGEWRPSMSMAASAAPKPGQRRRVDEQYDIKGSSVGRVAAPPRPGKIEFCVLCEKDYVVGRKGEHCTATAKKEHTAKMTLKDGDLRMKVYLGDELADLVVQQIAHDSLFLRNQGIMDYSFLLGISKNRFDATGDGETSALVVRQHADSASEAPAAAALEDEEAGEHAPPSVMLSSSNTWDNPMAVSSDSEGSVEGGEERKAQYSGDGDIDMRAHVGGSDEDARAAVRPTDSRSSLTGTAPSGGERGSSTASASSLPPPGRRLNNYYGGVRVRQTLAPEVYYIGIIDILQAWDTQKKLERCCKTRVLRQNAQEVSCVEPVAYQQRFYEFLSKHVIYRSRAAVRAARRRGRAASRAAEAAAAAGQDVV